MVAMMMVVSTFCLVIGHLGQWYGLQSVQMAELNPTAICIERRNAVGIGVDLPVNPNVEQHAHIGSKLLDL